MKTIIKYGFLLLCSLCLFACGGSDGEEPNPGPDPDPSGLILSVDSDSIPQITGVATFTVKLNGKDVTSNAKIIMKSNKEPLEGKTFTTRTVGTYTFYAQAFGSSISNDIKVTVYGKPERKFQKNVLFQGITSTTCVVCPGYHDAVHSLVVQNPGRCYDIEYHGTFNKAYPDPYAINYTQMLQDEYGISGQYGPVLVDSRGFLDPVNLGNVYQALNAPGDYGIAMNTTVSGSQVTVNVKLKTKKTTNETCRLAVVIVEDGLVNRQMDKQGAWMDGYVHNNVLRYYFTDLLGDEINAGSFSSSELTKTYTWSDLPAAYNKANLKAIAYLVIQTKELMWVENCAGVKLGNNIDFQEVDYIKN